MELWLKLSLLTASIVISLVVLATVVLQTSLCHKSHRLHQPDIEDNLPDDGNPSESPPSNSSWTNSWGWLRFNSKGYQTISSRALDSAPIDQQSHNNEISITNNVNAPKLPTIEYKILGGDLLRALPDTIPTRTNRATASTTNSNHKTKRKNSRGRKRERAGFRGGGRNERSPLLSSSSSRSVSPYKPTFPPGQGGSYPINIPNKPTKRPTFPLPQKLIWQRLTPQERAGMVWWRN